jgi:NMD protein affecting ribosome stability and mRNA decay
VAARAAEPEAGTCAMCHRRPAEYYDLVCQECREAIERHEPWTLAFDDILFQLTQLEEDDDDAQ